MIWPAQPFELLWLTPASFILGVNKLRCFGSRNWIAFGCKDESISLSFPTTASASRTEPVCALHDTRVAYGVAPPGKFQHHLAHGGIASSNLPAKK